MKLWIYGDSYSVPNRPKSGIESTWTEIVANNLNKELVYRSLEGVSNDWIYLNVIETCKEWTADDFVIIQLTAPWRDWLIEDEPDLANVSNCVFNDTNGFRDKELIKALKYYSTYLINDKKFLVQYNMIQNAIKFISSNYPQTKILVLPGFVPIDNIHFTLSNICYKEFSNEDIAGLFYDYHKMDPRINHFSECNHIVLANQVTNFFTSGVLPTLSDEYYEKIITKENYKTLDSF
jgi:hypothetical protein